MRITDATRWMAQTYGRAKLAPLTGQNHRAFGVFILALDLYAVADGTGRREAIRILDAATRAAQSSVYCVFLDAIPFVLDGDEGERLKRILVGR